MTWKDLEKNLEKLGKGPEKSWKRLGNAWAKDLETDFEQLRKGLGQTWKTTLKNLEKRLGKT